ncbi:importin-13-like isoform X2 [Oncorhynchus mykiss]|nr:importin-13-like isoform X2 [Oncorhynchus mykiss]
MRGLHFLFSVLPVEEILTSLTSLINPHVQRLDTLAHQEPSPTTKLCIIHMLGMLSSLFTMLDIRGQRAPPQPRPDPNPVVLVLQWLRLRSGESSWRPVSPLSDRALL